MANRELLFRAWDGLVMHDSYIIARPQAADVLRVLTDEEYAVKMYGVREWKLMECVGILDKNKVQLYESDIVKYPDPIKRLRYKHILRALTDQEKEDCYSIGELCYFDASWWLRNNGSITNLVWLFIPQGAHIMTISPHNLEVIGNIYQNPELVKIT